MTTDALYLTILRHGETIVMDFAEVDPVVPRSQIRVEPRLLTEITDELARITALANSQAALDLARGQAGDGRADSAQIALQRLGELMFAHLFPASAQRRLTDALPTDLFLRIDDQLVHIPWELACDGRDFLLTKFRIGRQVISQQQHRHPGPRGVRRNDQLRILIVVDPTETLPGAVDEADRLCSLLDECPNVECSLMSGKDVRKIDLLQSLGECDVVHYAGHAFFDAQNPSASGWVLHDAVVTALELSQVRHPPFLVFSNACQAGATAPWEANAVYQGQAFGIGSAFLLAGTQNYIGSFCVVYDAHSAVFAGEFYWHLLRGETVGKALRAARMQTRAQAEGSGLLWASYLHYGNPLFHLRLPAPETSMPEMRKPDRAEGTVPEVVTDSAREPSPVLKHATDVQETDMTQRDPESGADATRGAFPATEQGTNPHVLLRQNSRSRWIRRKHLALGAAALVVLLVAMAILLRTQLWMAGTSETSGIAEAYRVLDQKSWFKAQVLFEELLAVAEVRVKSQALAGLAAVAFARRDYQQALDFAGQAEILDPEIAYSHVIRGHILWNQGKLGEAAAEYQNALAQSHTAPWQQAIAHDRLGRIYSAQGAFQDALKQYDKAIGLQQNMAAVYANKGYVVDKLGRRQEALALYRQAGQIDPDDALAAMLLREAEQRERRAQDKEAQQRIDQLIAGLMQVYKEGRGPPRSSDEWTSMPLSIAFVDFQQKGPPAIRAGLEELSVSRLVEALRISGRMTVVEREFLDKLLAELRLGSSELADPASALRLGRILAARLIATGSLIRIGDTGQLSVHVSEAETTSQVASATEMIEAPETIGRTVEQIAQVLLQQLRQRYPLQGRIVTLTPQAVTLNIGAQQGVTPGVVLEVFREGGVHDPVGRVEVIRVEAQSSRARVLEQTEDIQPDWRVREKST